MGGKLLGDEPVPLESERGGGDWNWGGSCFYPAHFSSVESGLKSGSKFCFFAFLGTLGKVSALCLCRRGPIGEKEEFPLLGGAGANRNRVEA